MWHGGPIPSLTAPTMTQAGRGGQMTIAVQADFLNSTGLLDRLDGLGTGGAKRP
jgi:hypothetical protein